MTTRSRRSLWGIGALALIAASCASDASGATESSESAAPVSDVVETTVPASTTSPGPSTTNPPASTEILMTASSDFKGEQVVGMFEVPEGATGFGCESGSFEDTDGEAGVTRLMNCESGARVGTITLVFVPGDAPGPGDLNGPWNITDATGEFVGLSGDGDFSVVFDDETNTGAETLAGTVGYGLVDESTASDDVTEAAATEAGAVRFDTEIDWTGAQAKGTFDVADGADLLGCNSGTVVEFGGPSGITNTLTCTDGTRDGTITLRWQIEDDAEGPGEANGPWSVVGATGDFAGLTGDGLWSGTATDTIGLGSFPGTIEFGPIIDPSTQPVDDRPDWEQGLTAQVPAGTIQLPEFGGIQFELDEQRQIVQGGRAYTIVAIEDGTGVQPAEVDLVAPIATSSDEPLTTIDALTATLTNDLGAELVSIGEIVTPIGTAQGFAYTVENQDDLDRDIAVLQLDGGLWDPFPFGEFWLLDTERGLFMVTAEAVRVGPLLDEAMATARRVLETIEFVDLVDE